MIFFTYLQVFLLLGPGLHQVPRDGGAQYFPGPLNDVVFQVLDGRQAREAQRRALEVHGHHLAADVLQVRRVEPVPVVQALDDVAPAVPDGPVVSNRQILHELDQAALRTTKKLLGL